MYQTFLKRVIDLTAASLALLMLAPVMVIVYLAVRQKLKGPALFRQQRAGRHGKLFCLVKFRSMSDARDVQGNLLPDDERLPAFGRWLRSTSLDELPQLWNVLRGDMSLIGPRPLLPEYLPRYSAEQARRHEVRPGITGWSQVHGRNAVDWETRLKNDVWYVDHCSMVLDAKVVLLTLKAVLTRQGVSGEGTATMTPFMGTAPAKQTESIQQSASREVIVIGGGGHAKVVIATLKAAGRHVAAVYDDDPATWGTDVLGVRVQGPISKLLPAANQQAMLAIGNNEMRRKLASTLDVAWTSAIHPSAVVHESVTVGHGALICAGVVVQPDACIADHAIVNTGASVDHDTQVGTGAHIGPAACLTGGVTVGDGAFVGAGATVLPGVTVGEQATLGAGSVATRDVPTGEVFAGVPARSVDAYSTGMPDHRSANPADFDSLPDTRKAA